MSSDGLFIGIDGGGTHCRARLADAAGNILGEGRAGPANTRLGLAKVFAEIHAACERALREAGLPTVMLGQLHAGLGLAGLTLPSECAKVVASRHPFASAAFATDVHIACLGAHGGGDGGILILGTGSCGGGIVNARAFTLGGWGFRLSDHGSGANLGLAALRKALLAQEKIIPRTALSREIMARFDHSPEQAVLWADTARPRDYAELAPLVFHHAGKNDVLALQLLRQTVEHIVLLIEALLARGVSRIALSGGLAGPVLAYLPDNLPLVSAQGDALCGALQLARQSPAGDSYFFGCATTDSSL